MSKKEKLIVGLIGILVLLIAVPAHLSVKRANEQIKDTVITSKYE